MGMDFLKKTSQFLTLTLTLILSRSHKGKRKLKKWVGKSCVTRIKEGVNVLRVLILKNKYFELLLRFDFKFGWIKKVSSTPWLKLED
jgi:hypothetical protein